MNISLGFFQIKKKESNLKNEMHYNLDLIPSFIKNKSQPYQYWKHYFSLTSLSFSIRNLLQLSSYHLRYEQISHVVIG